MAPTKSIPNHARSRRVSPYPNPASLRKTIASKPSGKKQKSCKQIFSGKVFALTGSLLTTSGPASHEQVSNWITLHGGRVLRDVTDETTHLICSIEGYSKKNPTVQKAWKIGKKKCKIVVIDWIEDCLIKNPTKPKLVSDRDYTLEKTLARVRKGQNGMKESEKKFEEGVKACKELCDSRLHHVYYDGDGFEYKITLTRIKLGDKPWVEKYTLYLFESHAIPHTYMAGAKYSQAHRMPGFWRDRMVPKEFHNAYIDFKHFFRQTTGYEWDLRLEGLKGPEDRFVYQRPRLGRPVGLLPGGYVKPEDREEAVEGGDVETEGNGSGEDGAEVGDSDAGSERGSGEIDEAAVRGLIEGEVGGGLLMGDDDDESVGSDTISKSPPGQAVWVSSDEEEEAW